jgi:hypothetical protein
MEVASNVSVDGSSSYSASAGASSILSEKVQRALEVRTDTPAMKAALDALARLPDAALLESPLKETHSSKPSLCRKSCKPS